MQNGIIILRIRTFNTKDGSQVRFWEDIWFNTKDGSPINIYARVKNISICAGRGLSLLLSTMLMLEIDTLEL